MCCEVELDVFDLESITEIFRYDLETFNRNLYIMERGIMVVEALKFNLQLCKIKSPINNDMKKG